MAGIGIFLIVLVVAAAFSIYHLIRSRHIENLTKIEHGIIEEDQRDSLRPLLFLGIFSCSLGGGLLLAYLISQYSNVPEYVAMPTCLLLSGGLGLILSYLINSKITK
jgi:hypothetical protein